MRKSTCAVIIWSMLIGMSCSALIACRMSADGPQIGQGQVDQSTPEIAVTSYYEAINRRDLATLEQLLDESDASTRDILDRYELAWSHNTYVEVEDLKVHMIIQDDRIARMRVRFDITAYKDNALVVDSQVSGRFWGAVLRDNAWYLVGSSAVEREDWMPTPLPE